MKQLTTKQKKYLRASAHALKPVVYIGQQGMSAAVVKEIDRALCDHELIKVRFVDYKKEKKDLAEKIAAQTDAALIGITGHLACLYRPSPLDAKQRIVLPE
jgi:RNA-binding protein